MKPLLIATFAVFSSVTLFAQSNFLQDSVICDSWNTTTNAWNNSLRQINTYDANGNETSWLWQNWDGTSWVNFSLSTYSYDANGIRTGQLDQVWDTTNWADAMQYTFTYDTNGNQTGSLRKRWDGTNWVNNYLTTSFYDANGNQTGALFQNWYDTSTSWVNSFQNTHTYDVNGNQTSWLRQTWDGTNWVNYYQRTYTYDVNGNASGNLTQTWNGINWVNDFQYTFTYDVNGNWSGQLVQHWNGTSWVNHAQDFLTYDANGNRTSVLSQSWDATNWVNNSSCNYSYIELDCFAFFDLYADTIPHHYIAINTSSGTSPISCRWNWGDGSTDSIPYPSHTYDTAGFYTICLSIESATGCRDTFCNSYNLLKSSNTIVEVNVMPPLSTGIIENPEAEPSVFPNPASGYLIVELPYRSSKVDFRIFNMLGQFQLSSTAAAPKVNLDISTLANGIYILEVRTDNKISRQKFIKR